MSEAGFWARFVLAALAAWRLTHLLVKEDGPAELVVHLRTTLGNGVLGKLMDCFQCLSLFVAAPIAFFIGRQPVELLFAWLALSGAACLLERIGHAPIVLQSEPGSSRGDPSNVMLWSEADGTGQWATSNDSAVRYAIHPE